MRWTKFSFLAFFAALLMACGSEPPEAAPVLRPVRVHRVEAGGLSMERGLAGVVRAGVESRLSFRVSGTVERLAVQVGDRVARGRVLAELDPTDYELKVQEAEASRAQAQANLRRAEADYDRVRALYENNNASKAELDAARAAAESAEAQVEASRKRLAQARRQLGYTVLSAPTEGAVASVDVEVNENVKAGDKICLLVSGRQPEVEVSVPEVMIGRVEKGQSVTVNLDALPERTFPAEITEVGVAVTGAASIYPVTARLLEADAAIRSGMAAEVRFRFEDEDPDGRIVVPVVAVGEDRQGHHVYVVESEGEGQGRVRRRPVVIGRHGVGIEILEGLEVGDLVVTAGVRRLSDGMRVKLTKGAGGTG